MKGKIEIDGKAIERQLPRFRVGMRCSSWKGGGWQGERRLWSQRRKYHSLCLWGSRERRGASGSVEIGGGRRSHGCRNSWNLYGQRGWVLRRQTRWHCEPAFLRCASLLCCAPPRSSPTPFFSIQLLLPPPNAVSFPRVPSFHFTNSNYNMGPTPPSRASTSAQSYYTQPNPVISLLPLQNMQTQVSLSFVKCRRLNVEEFFRDFYYDRNGIQHVQEFYRFSLIND